MCYLKSASFDFLKFTAIMPQVKIIEITLISHLPTPPESSNFKGNTPGVDLTA